MPRMMAVTDPTPDLISVLDARSPIVFGARPVPTVDTLDAPALDAMIDAIDDRLETAPVDVALELHRGRRALELELSRVLEA